MKFFFKTHLSVWSALWRHYLGIMLPMSLLAAAIALLGVGALLFSAIILFIFVSGAAFVSISSEKGVRAYIREVSSRPVSYAVILGACIFVCMAFLAIQGYIPSVQDAMLGSYHSLFLIPIFLLAWMAGLQIWMGSRVKGLRITPDDKQTKPREIIIFSWLTRARRGLGEMTTPMFHFAIASMVVILLYDVRNSIIIALPDVIALPAALLLSAGLMPLMMLPLVAFFRCIVAGVAQDPHVLIAPSRPTKQMQAALQE